MKEQFLQAMQFRHACKVFDPDRKISEEDFRFILEVGRLSPSSFGFEPWHFVVVQDPALREKLKEDAWGVTDKLTTASHFVVVLSLRKSFTEADSPYIQYIMKDVQKLPAEVVEKKGGLYNKFCLSDFDLNSERAALDWAGKQSYLPLGNMMTAAACIGIDSCPMEGFVMETSERVLAEELGLDMQKYSLSCMLAFGYRVKEQPAKTRRSLDEVVSWK